NGRRDLQRPGMQIGPARTAARPYPIGRARRPPQPCPARRDTRATPRPREVRGSPSRAHYKGRADLSPVRGPQGGQAELLLGGGRPASPQEQPRPIASLEG